jgi:hypothetical protein
MIGIASLTNVFQAPVKVSEMAMSLGTNPYDRYIAVCSPAPNAAPPGRVLATAVEVCVIFMAWR